MQVIAGKAVAFKLAAERDVPRGPAPDRRERRRSWPRRSPSLGARVVSGGTDNHLLLVDVTPLGVTGKEAEHLLDEIGITVNKNAIPFDQLPAEHGLGHPRSGRRPRRRAASAPDEMRAVGRIIIDAIRERDDAAAQARLAGEVREIVARFPVPGLPAA